VQLFCILRIRDNTVPTVIPIYSIRRLWHLLKHIRPHVVHSVVNVVFTLLVAAHTMSSSVIDRIYSSLSNYIDRVPWSYNVLR